MPGVREGHLAELFRQAGLTPEETTLSVEAHFESFDDWWVPYTMGVGPAGAYVKKLDDAHASSFGTRPPGSCRKARLTCRRTPGASAPASELADGQPMWG